MAEYAKEDAGTAAKQQELQKKYVEYQVMEQQIKQMQKQLEKLEQQSMEASAVEQCIVDIGNAEKGKEVLVPVTGGVFFRAKLEDSHKFLVNVGSGVVVEKDLEGTRKLLQDQAAEIAKYKEQLTNQMTNQIAKFQELEMELKKLVES